MRDLLNNIHPVKVIDPVVITDNTAAVGAIIDINGYGTCTFVIATGTVSDADTTVTALLEESDAANFAGSNAVADVDLAGTEALASFTFAADSATRKLGYIGNKRYVRLTLTPANNTGNIPVSVVGILGSPRSAPTANPPA